MWALVCVAATACARPEPGAPPTPTTAPVAPTIRELPGRAIRVEGRGSGDSDPVLPDYAGGVPIGIDVVTLTHNGQSSFIVNAVQGSKVKTSPPPSARTRANDPWSSWVPSRFR